MPAWINISYWIVLHVTEAIQALWIVKVRNDAIRLQEAVDIRRTRKFSAKKRIAKVPLHLLKVKG